MIIESVQQVKTPMNFQYAINRGQRILYLTLIFLFLAIYFIDYNSAFRDIFTLLDLHTTSHCLSENFLTVFWTAASHFQSDMG